MSVMHQKTQRDHRDLFKAKTPPWKEVYRKRCLDRLQQSRDKLKARFRQIAGEEKDVSTENNSFVNELMREELQGFQRLLDKSPETAEDESKIDIESVLNLFEDIQEELKKEELKILEEFEQYEQSLQAEEAVLCSAISQMSTDEVICPICQKNHLLKNKTTIFCKCGMRIDTEQDCLTLANVKKLLNDGITEHSNQCDGEALFSVVNDQILGTNTLLMSCKVCEWMSVVI